MPTTYNCYIIDYRVCVCPKICCVVCPSHRTLSSAAEFNSFLLDSFLLRKSQVPAYINCSGYYCSFIRIDPNTRLAYLSVCQSVLVCSADFKMQKVWKCMSNRYAIFDSQAGLGIEGLRLGLGCTAPDTWPAYFFLVKSLKI